MNQQDGLSNENRRAFWRQAVQLLQESGLTTAAFARREKLSPQTLSKWKIHFIGKDILPGHQVPDTSAGLAVREKAAHVMASSSVGLAPGCSVQATLDSVPARESFSPIRIVPEVSVANSNGTPPRRVRDSGDGLDNASTWQILVSGSRRIAIGNGRVPACLAEVVRVLESMESQDGGREDVC